MSSPDVQAPATSQEVRVAIPADPRFLRVARLTAAGVAGDLGFGLRDLEDLRVAVDEMCAVLIEDADAGVELELRYRIGPDELIIEGSCATNGGEPRLHPVAAELLRMTADEFDLSADATGRSFRLVKSRHGLDT